MDSTPELPSDLEDALLAILVRSSAGREVQAEVTSLCAANPRHAAALRACAARVQALLGDMQRRLGAVWRLSQSTGRYEVLEELGRGALGTVSIVRDRMLGRRVAFKTIHQRHGRRLSEIDPWLIHRFLDEAQIAAQLHHPGIPPVHDLGIGAAGVPFYTMRFVRGRTLAEWMHRNEQSTSFLQDLARILVRVGDTLAHAHARSVLHRDVKPANILVGRYGEVCVIDWGLARAQGARDDVAPGWVGTDRGIDLASTHLGSPGFMSPEQQRGEWHTANDVFSVAAIVHFALVGAPPTMRRETTAYALPDTAWHRDRRLAAICQRGIAPVVEDRYPTMTALRDDLQRFVDGKSPSAGGDRWFDRLRAPWRHWPRVARRAPTAVSIGDLANGADGDVALTRAVVATPRAAISAGPRSHDRLDGFAERLRSIAAFSTPMGRFAPEAPLGAGGMARVCRARDELLGRAVALKTPRAEDPIYSMRPLDEAQIAAQLDHPAVLTVHEIGVDEDGRLRIVMPLAAGGTLARHLAEHRDSWLPAAEALLQVAWGLAFAHDKGVLHRDVKPANILLGTHGDAYLCDWGASILRGDNSASGIRLHRGGTLGETSTAETVSEEPSDQIVGTPLYMPPEALQGEPQIAPTYDVWALGITLHEILVGEHPLGPRPPSSVFELMNRTAHAESMALPPARVPAAARPLIPVCEIALRKDPAGRFTDARLFARALDAALNEAKT
ncbi:MAG TPA: serine/threonine-protein kinase [Planctomycetota bacterium]|nr:serine/threonine-protein kinase [Planctomycetota bacterium]